MVHRSPRCFGLDRSRWRLVDLGRVLPWLRGRHRGTVHRLLGRLGVRYKRGRAYVHSPDLAYDAKVAAITAAQLLARAHPDAIALLYEDEFTYYRRPSVSRAWAPRGVDAPRAGQGLGTNTRRRVAACLDAMTGALVPWQRGRFDRATLLRYYAAVEAAYPEAEVIFLAQDNWPVHTHPDVLAGLPPKLVLLPLPTYAPWTNPVEDVWRALNGEVLHHHPFGDDWAGLQRAVTAWLAQWRGPAPTLLHRVGLAPCPEQ
ncbi:MAG TPA: IS630 family transposase [Candidatus Thermoplasmatota archaeon]|nr:IS630 family transposase [Candidatus Thermoplasmatota archaeon]